MSRELTPDEVQERFLEHVRAIVDYWEREARAPTVREKLDGLAFSILAAIDGSSVLPRFVLAPDPHPEDRAYHEEQGEDWYPEAPAVACDISGDLHERLSRPRAKTKR